MQVIERCDSTRWRYSTKLTSKRPGEGSRNFILAGIMILPFMFPVKGEVKHVVK